MSVHTKLMQARLTLQACKLEKTGHNKFAGYKYFELGDFIPTIQEIFANLKLCGVVSYGKETATLTIMDTEAEGGQPIVIESPMSEANLKGCHPVQNLGAVETYIRRYLWVTALEICEHDALDATAGKETNGIKPSDGVEDRVPKERQEPLTRVVSAVVDCLDAQMPAEALKALEAVTDPDEKVFCWQQLDSKQRSLLKRTKQELSLQKGQ